MRKLINYPSVLSTVALVFAMAGGAYAVAIAPKDSVVSKSIKNGQVKPGDMSAKAANPAYFFRGVSQPGEITATTFAELAALMASTESLPAGDYAIAVTAELGAVQGFPECNIYLGDETFEFAYGARADALDPTDATVQIPATVQFTHTIPKGASGVDSHLELRCVKEGAQVATISDIRITAIRVGSLTEV